MTDQVTYTPPIVVNKMKNLSIMEEKRKICLKALENYETEGWPSQDIVGNRRPGRGGEHLGFSHGNMC